MERRTRKDVIRFSMIEALYFAIFAISSYQTGFLKSNGLTSTQIGLIVSISSCLGLVVVPFWGILTDTRLGPQHTFVLTVTVTAGMYGLLPLFGRLSGHSVLFYTVYIPLIFLFKQPTNSMMDSWAIATLSPQGVSYGSVRRWGSIGYAAVSLILGSLVGKVINEAAAFAMMLPLAVILIFVCSRGNQPAQGKARGKKEPFRLGLLLKNPSLVMYLLYSIGLNIYLAVTLIFMAYILPAASVDAEKLGVVTGFRAVIEIISMTIGARLARKMKLKYIMILPGVLFGLEHLLYGAADGMASILAIMTLSGLAGGFVYSLGPSYIYEITPREVTNTAQSCNAMTMTLVSIIGSAVGGVMIEKLGIRFFTTVLGCIILTLTVLFTLSVFLIKERGK